MQNTVSDYKKILLGNRPLLDVRSPGEFKKGSFPGAVNLPILTDIERQKVGYCYKHKGSAAAVALGHQLVTGEVKHERVQAILRNIQTPICTVFVVGYAHGFVSCG